MAKRKRLTPALLNDAPAAAPAARAPIAQIAGDVASTAAFEALRAELEGATREGRIIRAIPLEQVHEAYLIRDRQHTAEEDVEALYHSIRSRGQQAPIEVVMVEDGFGLISGWRRLQALRALYADTGEERFATVQALVRQPAAQADAYVAMVEENEIRANLSFYERARVAVQTLRAGVFETEKEALQSLFASVSFSKRSKIKSFMPVVEALDEVLHAPQLIPERLGLALSKRLAEDGGAAARLRAHLREAHATGRAEREVLEAAVSDEAPAESKPEKNDRPTPAPNAAAGVTLPLQRKLGEGLELLAREGRVVVQGTGVDAAFVARLEAFLRKHS
ncbi:ParB N-terminal domain-containing protein [Sulfitobacter sp. F26169L]|uniref:ParB/RepB/Spo0J family partition protein n=1 Tax=Sulfitobacter sp. F26169L TaxID=2996015 RepID=UPI002260F85D|nr:ParB N-terminal domain-containing protein [Sulfitobacter sp. F26169L]MCX7568036.1 ParB N-terminal domain-containing protein [Sulfitobacter sp. F26169L]